MVLPNTLGLTGDLTVKNGMIYANTLLYNEHEDPACCPSHKEVIKLKFSNGNEKVNVSRFVIGK